MTARPDYVGEFVRSRPTAELVKVLDGLYSGAPVDDGDEGDADSIELLMAEIETELVRRGVPHGDAFDRWFKR